MRHIHFQDFECHRIWFVCMNFIGNAGGHFREFADVCPKIDNNCD